MSPIRHRDREYLCQYGNCDVRLPMGKTFIVGFPDHGGAKRFCSSRCAMLAMAKEYDRAVHDELVNVLRDELACNDCKATLEARRP